LKELEMSKSFSFPFWRTNRRGFLRAGIVGGAGLAVAQFVPPKELRADTLWEASVFASSDDAQQDEIGRVNLTNAYIILTPPYMGGFRFTDVTVPNSATILGAYFSICLYDDAQAADVPVYLQAADDAPTFTTQKWNLNRAKTTHWGTLESNAVGGTWVQSSDISAAVQDVVNRPGWVSGNAMAVIAYGGEDGDTLVATTWDATQSTLSSAKLSITYR
jgi:hypothetical protein